MSCVSGAVGRPCWFWARVRQMKSSVFVKWKEGGSNMATQTQLRREALKMTAAVRLTARLCVFVVSPSVSRSLICLQWMDADKNWKIKHLLHYTYTYFGHINIKYHSVRKVIFVCFAQGFGLLVHVVTTSFWGKKHCYQQGIYRDHEAKLNTF